MEAIAAHAMLLDEHDFRAGAGDDQRGHKTGRAPADHYGIDLEPARSTEVPRQFPPPHAGDDEACQQRHQADENDGNNHRRADQARQRLDVRQFRSRVDQHRGDQQHAGLAGDVIRADADRRQRHQQIDEEKRENRHHADAEQVEGPVLANAAVDRFELVAVTVLHPIAQEETGDEERQCRADTGGEGNDHGTPDQPEQRAAQQGQHQAARNRQGRAGDINQKVEQRGPEKLSSV